MGLLSHEHTELHQLVLGYDDGSLVTVDTRKVCPHLPVSSVKDPFVDCINNLSWCAEKASLVVSGAGGMSIAGQGFVSSNSCSFVVYNGDLVGTTDLGYVSIIEM